MRTLGAQRLPARDFSPSPTLLAPSKLSLPEKVGQLLCLGWMEPDALYNLNPQARHAVRELNAGAVLVMGRNIQRPGPSGTTSDSTADIPAARKMLNELHGLGKIPPLIATDQEGGRVARFRSPFTKIPSAGVIGATGNPALARAAAQVIASELAAVGIDWDFAPVADILSASTNAEIGNRSFGSSPKLVADMIAAQADGFRAGGVVACVKHFPGQGDTSVDSHLGLPHLPFRRDAMMARELVPFARAAKIGLPSLMAAHIVVPSLDPAGLPARLSAPILTGLLRRILRYDGLVITDDLEMDPIVGNWGVGRAAVMAINAGADMVLVAHTPDSQQAAYDALLSAAKSGVLPAARIDQALRRIFTVKRWVASRPAVASIADIGSAKNTSIALQIKQAEVKRK